MGKIIDKTLTPTEYVKAMNINEPSITDNISIADFDELIADEYGLWNYCIEDADHVLKDDHICVYVQFIEDTRLVEIYEDVIERIEVM